MVMAAGILLSQTVRLNDDTVDASGPPSTAIDSSFVLPARTPLFDGPPPDVDRLKVIDEGEYRVTFSSSPSSIGMGFESAHLVEGSEASASVEPSGAEAIFAGAVSSGDGQWAYQFGATRAEIVMIRLVLEDGSYLDTSTVAHPAVPGVRFFVIEDPGLAKGVDDPAILYGYDAAGRLLTATRRELPPRPQDLSGGGSDLQPPTVGAARSSAQPLGEAVRFTSCAEASAAVSGMLDAVERLNRDGFERSCYVEQSADSKVRHAGSLITPAGMDAASLSIIEVSEQGGTAVMVTTGDERSLALAGSDPNAPGGGYRSFALGDGTFGRVVRLSPTRYLAMLEVEREPGTRAHVSISSTDSPDDLESTARALYSQWTEL